MNLSFFSQVPLNLRSRFVASQDDSAEAPAEGIRGEV